MTRQVLNRLRKLNKDERQSLKETETETLPKKYETSDSFRTYCSESIASTENLACVEILSKKISEEIEEQQPSKGPFRRISFVNRLSFVSHDTRSSSDTQSQLFDSQNKPNRDTLRKLSFHRFNASANNDNSSCADASQGSDRTPNSDGNIFKLTSLNVSSNSTTQEETEDYTESSRKRLFESNSREGSGVFRNISLSGKFSENSKRRTASRRKSDTFFTVRRNENSVEVEKGKRRGSAVIDIVSNMTKRFSLGDESDERSSAEILGTGFLNNLNIEEEESLDSVLKYSSCHEIDEASEEELFVKKLNKEENCRSFKRLSLRRFNSILSNNDNASCAESSQGQGSESLSTEALRRISNLSSFTETSRTQRRRSSDTCFITENHFENTQEENSPRRSNSLIERSHDGSRCSFTMDRSYQSGRERRGSFLLDKSQDGKGIRSSFVVDVVSNISKRFNAEENIDVSDKETDDGCGLDGSLQFFYNLDALDDDYLNRQLCDEMNVVEEGLPEPLRNSRNFEFVDGLIQFIETPETNAERSLSGRLRRKF